MQTEGENRIASPREELESLKKRIHEIEMASAGKERAEVIKEAIKEHAEKDIEKEFSGEYRIPESEIKEKAERISKGALETEHEKIMDELLEMARERGIHSAVSVAKKLDPHLEDEFHDALVKHLQEGE